MTRYASDGESRHGKCSCALQFVMVTRELDCSIVLALDGRYGLAILCNGDSATSVSSDVWQTCALLCDGCTPRCIDHAEALTVISIRRRFH